METSYPRRLSTSEQFSKLFTHIKSAVIVFNLEFPNFEYGSKTLLGSNKDGSLYYGEIHQGDHKGAIFLGSSLRQLRNPGPKGKFSRNIDKLYILYGFRK